MKPWVPMQNQIYGLNPNETLYRYANQIYGLSCYETLDPDAKPNLLASDYIKPLTIMPSKFMAFTAMKPYGDMLNLIYSLAPDETLTSYAKPNLWPQNTCNPKVRCQPLKRRTKWKLTILKPCSKI
jgi:hypothetical protein